MRYRAGRLVVRLGAGGWIVTFIATAIFYNQLDLISALDFAALFVIGGFLLSVVMTVAGVLMSIAMLIAITMDAGVRISHRIGRAMDRAADRRTPTVNLDEIGRDAGSRRNW